MNEMLILTKDIIERGELLSWKSHNNKQENF
jgi:hypothetical protein